MRGCAPLSDSLFYADCPRCGQRVGLPFNRLGGPQVSEHYCGRRFNPHPKVRYMVAASGTGYIAYAFDADERVEERFVRWVDYWVRSIRQTVGIDCAREVA